MTTGPLRRPTVVVDVGGVKVGSAQPVVVQSMTNTDTADVRATVAQVRALHAAGSELVRVTVNTEEAARAVPDIVAEVDVPGGPADPHALIDHLNQVIMEEVLRQQGDPLQA